jgi:hypothetical protein
LAVNLCEDRTSAVRASISSPRCEFHPGRIGERRGGNIATFAVARKLLALVCYGLRDGHIRALAAARAV